MSEDQVTYWSLFGVTLFSFVLGTWIFFGIDGLVKARAQIVKDRWGEAPVKIFVIIMRVLGLLLVLLTSYLFAGLWRVLPCALK